MTISIIVYCGEDKLLAKIIELYYKRLKESHVVVIVKDYKPYQTENMYVMGEEFGTKFKETSKAI